MPSFTNPVGPMGRNEIHDVALLQGALMILKTQKRMAFWDGPVDGDWRRHQQSLTAALKQLEVEANITNGPGRIEPNGPLARKLKQLLPPQYQSLSAIQGTACLTIKDPYGGQHKGPELKDLDLHVQCAKDLERLLKAGADKLGLELVIAKEETDHKGRCVFELKPHGVKCLDANMRPQADNGPTPRPVIQALSKQAMSASTLDVSPHGTKLEVKTKQAQRQQSRRAKDERLKARVARNSFARQTTEVVMISAAGKKIPPVAPIGVDIDANIRAAESRWDPRWFYNQVKGRGPWDYKQRGRKFENFGNFHYGAVGAAMGFPEIVLLNEAGRAQIRDGNVSGRFGRPGPSPLPFLGTGSYGDDPKDQFWIMQGIDYYKNRNRNIWEKPKQEAP